MENTPIIYKARLKIEATTALRVGSGKEGILVDSLVAKDVNGLPYIPGTSLAGVLRHTLSQQQSSTEDAVKKLFGFQNREKEGNDPYPKGQGSRVLFTDAHLLAVDGKRVHEGLEDGNYEGNYYQGIKQLPERDHVRITHRGVAQDTGKYEEELVRRGTRFVFDIELHGTADDQTVWQELLAFIHDDAFRIGAGTRKGYGAMKIAAYYEKVFDLNKREDLEEYLGKENSLNDHFGEWTTFSSKVELEDQFFHYQIQLTPKDFFLFGAGMGNGEINALPKLEKYIDWNEDQPTLTEAQVLIPATSIKGAISHRVAFHYNHIGGVEIEKGNTAQPNLNFDANTTASQINVGVDFDQLENIGSNDERWEKWLDQIDRLALGTLAEWKQFEEEIAIKQQTADTSMQHVGEQNEAVRTLFGYAKNNKNEITEEIEGARGKVLFSDLYEPYKSKKVFNHVAIDRFTGGGRDGALFQEEVVTTQQFQLDIQVEESAFDTANVQDAFEKTLDDLTTGLLQLGGHTTKGHGIFQGTWEIIKHPKSKIKNHE